MINNPEDDLSVICPPACTEVKYFASMSTVPLKAQDGRYQNLYVPTYLFRNIYLIHEFWIFVESLVHIFFKDSSIVKFKRSELYKFTDIISNIGGTLGLCTGFSLISAIELVYFITCRYFCKKSKVWFSTSITTFIHNFFVQRFFIWNSK